MVKCNCGRALVWTLEGKVTCPAGHMEALDVAHVEGVRSLAGTAFEGTVYDVVITPTAADHVDLGCYAA